MHQFRIWYRVLIDNARRNWKSQLLTGILMVICALLYCFGSQIYESRMVRWIHYNPAEAARKEAASGKAYLGQDCRVLNTNYALTHPGSHIEVGYLKYAGKKEAHLWCVDSSHIVDLAAPPEWPRVSIAKFSPERGWYDVTAKPGDRNWQKLEWGKKYLEAYIRAKKGSAPSPR